MEKKIKKICELFFERMLVFNAEIMVKKVHSSYEISVNSEEPGMIIGKNGETMKAIEQILRLLVNRKMGESINLSLDIAGYRDKRRREIEEEALRSAKNALRTGRVQILSPMNAFERRIVHTALSKNQEIETESVGEEPNRRVMIKKKRKILI